MSLSLQLFLSLRQHCKIHACEIHLLVHRSLSSALDDEGLSMLHREKWNESIRKVVNAKMDRPYNSTDHWFACHSGQKENAALAIRRLCLLWTWGDFSLITYTKPGYNGSASFRPITSYTYEGQ